jgi:hypothetical protein
MKKIRIRELPDWPPQPGGAYGPETVFPMGGEALVSEVFPVHDRVITFKGMFGKDSHSYHYKAETAKIAEQLHSLVKDGIGMTVAELGDLEIEV